MDKTDQKQVGATKAPEPANKLEILNLTDEEKLSMMENLVLSGSCEYKFLLFNKYPVVLKSLTFEEQKDLTTEIGRIPFDVTDTVGQNADGTLQTKDRQLSMSEYNNLVSEKSMIYYLKSYNDKDIATAEDIGRLAQPVIKIISERLRAFMNTVDVVLTSVDEIKNS